jgi:hypothetical protein
MIGLATVQRSAVTLAALRLCRELEYHGITADPHEGDHVAALSVWIDLVVWCEYGSHGLHYRWWTGRVSDHTGRWVYTWCPASATATAARRVAQRFRELHPAYPQSSSAQRPSSPDGSDV